VAGRFHYSIQRVKFLVHQPCTFGASVLEWAAIRPGRLASYSTTLPQEGVVDYPSLYQAADRIAAQRQQNAVRVVLLQVAVALVLAIGSDLNGFLNRPAQVVLAVLSAGLLVVILSEQLKPRRTRFEQEWFLARGIAESLKTATWRYMMGVPPFEQAGPSDAEFEHLAHRLQEGLRGMAEGSHHPVHVTSGMRLERDREWSERRTYFLAARVHDQLHWYSRRAELNARRSRQFAQASSCSLGLALAISIGRIVAPEINLVGVFTTLAASLVAWSQTRRFEELADTYFAARAELEQIGTRLERATDEADFIASVLDAENAISREHGTWLARSTRGLR
jgi:hypothetical protein